MALKSISLNKFTTRYAVRETFKNEKGYTEAAIYLTDKKEFCAASEQYKFYAKIGGLLNLEDLTDQKVKDLLPKLGTSGFFLVMNTHRTTKGPKTYAMVYPQFNQKALEIPISSLVSFLPRIDGHTGDFICGLRISSREDPKHREWTRFIGSTKSIPNGFNELKFGYNYDEDYKKNTKAKYVGFYVNKNSSLVVFDIGTIDPNKSINPDQNRTLIQEGGFVYADVDLLFKVCSESEDKLYSAKELYEKFKDNEKSVLGSDRYKKNHFIRDNKEPKDRSVLFFLKSTPYLQPYELHITDDLSKDPLFKGKRTAVLVIPNGGQFESEFWSLKDGIEVIQKLQKAQPWNKYLQKESDAQSVSFEVKISDIPIMSYPTEERNGKTPQNEELYKNIRRARKELFGEKENSKKSKNQMNDKKQTDVKLQEKDSEKRKSKAENSEKSEKQTNEETKEKNTESSDTKNALQTTPTTPTTPTPPEN